MLSTSPGIEPFFGGFLGTIDAGSCPTPLFLLPAFTHDIGQSGGNFAHPFGWEPSSPYLP